MVWKMMFLFQGCILMFHVDLPGCLPNGGLLVMNPMVESKKNHLKEISKKHMRGCYAKFPKKMDAAVQLNPWLRSSTAWRIG